MDLHGGYGASLAGHAHPAIVRAVKAQVERGTHFAQPTENAIVMAAARAMLTEVATDRAYARIEALRQRAAAGISAAIKDFE